MNYALINTASLLLNITFGIYTALVIIRFLMQFFRVSFANPAGQFIIRVTNPPLMPLRRIIPPIRSIDSASIVLAFSIHMLFIFTLAIISTQAINLVQMLIWSAVGLVTVTMSIYLPLIFISIISSWLPDLRHQPVMQLINALVEPVIAPFRRILPDLGGLDLSPIFPLLIMQLIKVFLASFPMLVPYFILGY